MKEEREKLETKEGTGVREERGKRRLSRWDYGDARPRATTGLGLGDSKATHIPRHRKWSIPQGPLDRS